MAEQKLRSVEQQLVQANDAIANLCVQYDQLFMKLRTLDAAHQPTTEAVVICGNDTSFFVSLRDRVCSCFPSKAMQDFASQVITNMNMGMGVYIRPFFDELH